MVNQDSNRASNNESLLKSSKELLELAATETSSKGIDKILKDHSGCITGEYCDRCKIIHEVLFEELIYELAENPNLNDKQQETVLELAHDYQRVWTSFVSHPKISDEIRRQMTSGGEFWHDMDDYQVTRVIEAMKANPRFTAAEIEEFRSYFEEDWGYGQDNESEN